MAIYIALGSNLGDKENNLKEALRRLAKKGITVRRVSGFIVTEPYGVTDQPDFLNAVAEIETEKSPSELLQVLLQTEKEMGRRRTRRWGERNIDLDLLLYDDHAFIISNNRRISRLTRHAWSRCYSIRRCSCRISRRCTCFKSNKYQRGQKKYGNSL